MSEHIDYQQSPWEGLNPPYSTIVADPPWNHDEGSPVNAWGRSGSDADRVRLRYSSMPLPDIEALPVADLAAVDAHLYLWTTNRFLRAAFGVAEAWGFKHSQTLTWCKPPIGVGPGGAFANTTEYVLFCRRGSLKPLQRVETTWWPGGARLGSTTVGTRISR